MKIMDPMQANHKAVETQEERPSKPMDHRVRSLAIRSLVLLVVFGMGVLGGYLMWGREAQLIEAANGTAEAVDGSTALMHHVNPPEGYTIEATFGDIGPKMVAAGAIDLTRFIDLYKKQGKPLSDEELSILTKGIDKHITIRPENAYFLLNFFWAFGLVNHNPILTDGAMMSKGAEYVGGFASTGGWTLGKKQATELFSSIKLVTLTEEQQALLLKVASSVYRPCCNNPTHFPDCNHGMAMLGLLELMAAQGASEDEMFEAAKYVTAFWYPQQMLEVATALQIFQGVNFPDAEARTVVSEQFASGTGFQAVHQWLGENNALPQAPSSGGSCGV